MKLFSPMLVVGQLLFLTSIVKGLSYTLDDSFDLSRREDLEEFYARQDLLDILSTRDLVEELESRLDRRGRGGGMAKHFAKHAGEAMLDGTMGDVLSGREYMGDDPSLAARGVKKHIKSFFKKLTGGGHQSSASGGQPTSAMPDMQAPDMGGAAPVDPSGMY